MHTNNSNNGDSTDTAVTHSTACEPHTSIVLLLLIGLPASGKSSFASYANTHLPTLFAEQHHSARTLQVHHLNFDAVYEYLQQQQYTGNGTQAQVQLEEASNSSSISGHSAHSNSPAFDPHLLRSVRTALYQYVIQFIAQRQTANHSSISRNGASNTHISTTTGNINITDGATSPVTHLLILDDNMYYRSMRHIYAVAARKCKPSNFA